MKVALVCVAKNEDNYIEEWIKYNLKLGFDNIFIYANDWKYTNNNTDIIIIEKNGKAVQSNSYNDFKLNFNNNYNWAAFFDVDEFLVLKKHNNIKSFLEEYDDCNAIGINWAMFGNNGHETVLNNNYSVLERFTKRGDINFGGNKHIKTIVKLPCNKYQDIHCVCGDWFNLNKEIRSGAFNEPIDWSIAQLNHYFSKSTEELKQKCNRGRADTGEIRNFEEHKICLSPLLNYEEDFLARDFFNASNGI